jgi:pyoverdine/dityrosine biosynthesis protein Dit1
MTGLTHVLCRDWTKYADDTSFQAFIDDNAQYLGGWGNSNNDFIVEDGPFPDITASYPAKHKVRRRFNPLGFNLNFFPQAWQNLTRLSWPFI